MASFFFLEERPSLFRERHRVDARATNPTLWPPFDKDVHFDDDIIRKVKNYTEGVEGDSQV